MKETSKRILNTRNLPDITSETFFKVFPFSFVIDPTMSIFHMGQSIKNLFSLNTILIGRPVDEVFRLIRPDISLEWNKVIYLYKYFINLFNFSYLVMVDILFF